MDDIDDEYERLVEHLHDWTRKAKSFKIERGLFQKTLELISVELHELQETKNSQRRAEVLAEAAEAGKSLRYVRRDFASHKTRMTALRNPKGTAIASRRGMEKIIYDFYSDLFDSHVHFPPHHLREDGHVIPKVLPSDMPSFR
ncbi:hypothetical protein RB195_023418 [Necator americanus]|uniref:Uncharacterized protein n=1 Tax=Necator americanus TaxID=51031 RepID=A0ABR1EJ39_NECAM